MSNPGNKKTLVDTVGYYTVKIECKHDLNSIPPDQTFIGDDKLSPFFHLSTAEKVSLMNLPQAA